MVVLNSFNKYISIQKGREQILFFTFWSRKIKKIMLFNRQKIGNKAVLRKLGKIKIS
jgi:hypothetical protein